MLRAEERVLSASSRPISSNSCFTSCGKRWRRQTSKRDTNPATAHVADRI
jgi:hypothetical protein